MTTNKKSVMKNKKNSVKKVNTTSTATICLNGRDVVYSDKTVFVIERSKYANSKSGYLELNKSKGSLDIVVRYYFSLINNNVEQYKYRLMMPSSKQPLLLSTTKS